MRGALLACLDGSCAPFVLAFLLAALVAWAAVPGAAALARKWNAIDVPGGRHAHRAPTPRLGGLSILMALLAAVPLSMSLLRYELGDTEDRTAAILLIAVLVASIGVRDDIRPLRPAHKLLGLSMAGVALVFSGNYVCFVEIPFVGRFWVQPIGGLLTIGWLVACTNAVNLIDGVDGLGSSVVLVASSVLALLAVSLDDMDGAILLLALAGACAGFLIHNREPARIFLGDSGSLLLGYLLAAVSISGSSKRATALFLIAAICALAVPLMDTTQVFVRRFRDAFGRASRNRIAEALKATAVGDRGHLHHRLLMRGLTHRQVVRRIALTTLATSLCALAVLPAGGISGTRICGCLLAGGIALYRLSLLGKTGPSEPREVVLVPPGRRVTPAAGRPSPPPRPRPAGKPGTRVPARSR
ncbi:MAG: MraY family glycosyltransferase [Planctomycetota bacterium]